MPKIIIESDRLFQMWKYTVGHRQLLLRSVKSSDQQTRIDVLFKGVSQFHIPTVLKGLVIAEDPETTDVRELFALQESEAYTKRLKLFTIRGVDFLGYVSAIGVFHHEDTGEYYDPSFFPSINETYGKFEGYPARQ
jgi:hypothetical protein